MCLIPLLMAGYAIPVSTSWHSSDLTPTAIVEAQTCTQGPGAYAKATMTGAYMAGVQYGFGVEHHGFEFIVKPQLGVAYVARGAGVELREIAGGWMLVTTQAQAESS